MERLVLRLVLLFSSLSQPVWGDAATNVPEITAEGYVLVYTLNIPDEAAFRNGSAVPYSVDASATAPGFDRIAYYLELDDGTGSQWVYASMDAFTDNAASIGLPHNTDNPVAHQQKVSNLNVVSNAAGIVTGSAIATGNIEFWPSNYNPTNDALIANASDSAFDFGDGGGSVVAGFGSFQIHNHDIDGNGPGATGQTLIAYNRWGVSNTGSDDLGIGTSPTGNPDHTFGSNAGTYTLKTLQVLVRPTPYSLELDEFPQTLQFCPRNLTTGLGEFEVMGRENAGGFTEAVLRIYRNGAPFGMEQIAALDYSSGPAEFDFTAQIPAELAQFDAQLVLRDGIGTEYPARRSLDIVAGDVYIVQGQSNADSAMYSGSANSYQSQYVRTYGQNSEVGATTAAAGDWLVAGGDGSRNVLAGIGQWSMVMASELAADSGVPIAILNGAHGGKPISFFQRNDADPEDLATNYGRLLHRARKADLTDAVRGFFFYQGESDAGNSAVHDAGFVSLYNDWKIDYPNVEQYYVFQLREGCGVTRFDLGLRDVQRRFQDRFADITSFPVNGLDGHDGCHYSFSGGYELMGQRIEALVTRDFYGDPDDPNIDPPNPDHAELVGAGRDRIRIVMRRPEANLIFDSGAEADFALVGSAATVLSGSIVDGAIELQLSGTATGVEAIVYGGHIGVGPWVSTSTGAPLFSFSEPIVDPGPTPRFVSPARSEAVDVGVPTTLEITGDPGTSPIASLELLIGPNSVATTTGSGPLQFQWTPPAPGSYRLTARVTDDADLTSQVQLHAFAGRPISPGVAGATVWLRPETGIETDSEGRIVRWLDQSGNNHHAEQADPLMQPAFEEGTLGCLPMIRFLPGQYLSSSDGMSAASYTKVIRYKLESFDESNNIVSSAVGGANTHALYHAGVAFPRMYHGGTFVTASSAVNLKDETIVIATYDASTNLGTLYLNGVMVGSGTAGSDNPDTSYQIGAYNDDNSMNGSVGEIIIYPRVLDSSERATLMAYLIDGCPTPFASWQLSTPGGTDPGDPDGDGLSGPLESALGLNPLVSDRPSFIRPNELTTGEFYFDRPLGYNHYVYDVFLSSDLETWHKVPLLPAAIPTPGEPMLERIIIPLNGVLPEGPATFGRLGVEVE